MKAYDILLLAISLLLATAASAQDTNEFQRIAKRIMDAYEVGDELEHAPDSGHFYGGAYLGASSNGRAMPSKPALPIGCPQQVWRSGYSTSSAKLFSKRYVDTPTSG